MESLTINNQNCMTLLGAKKVISCTQSQAVIETTDQKVIVTGGDIEVKKLNLENGEVCLNGNFTNIKFAFEGEKKPLFKRIFK